MGAVIVLITVLYVSARLDAAISLASGAYYQNFDGTLETDWVLSQVATYDIPLQGRTELKNVNTNDYRGTIIMNASGGYGTEGQTFAPLKPAGSYMNYGFGGKWLTNSTNQTVPSGGSKLDLIRTATVSFNQLGDHETLSLQFLLGAGDSFDGIEEGIFEVMIDGNLVWRRQFSSGGGVTGSPNAAYPNVGPAPTTLVTSANLLDSGFYSEKWTSDASNEMQRTVEGWTTEAAYRVILNDIAHTSDTMTLQFLWRGVDSAWSDEFLALDNVVVTVPEPKYSVMVLLGVAILSLRRRK